MHNFILELEKLRVCHVSNEWVLLITKEVDDMARMIVIPTREGAYFKEYRYLTSDSQS